MPVLCGQNGDDGEAVYKQPDEDNAGIEDPRTRPPASDNRQVRVDGNSSDEATRSQVSIRVEEALDEAGRGIDEYAASPEPYVAEQKGRGLVHVGQEQVGNEDQELVGLPGLGLRQLLNVLLVGRLGVLSLGPKSPVLDCEFDSNGRLGHVFGNHIYPRRPGQPPGYHLEGQVHEQYRRCEEGQEGEDGDGHEAIVHRSWKRREVAALRMAGVLVGILGR